MMNDSLILADEYEADHVKHSVGGLRGHLLRRAIHLSMAFLPWLYYWHGALISDIIGMTIHNFVTIVVCLIILAELIRLKIGFTIIGQRDYEAKQLSALFWGAISVGFALIYSPQIGLMGAGIGLPLIYGLSFGDPVMGETRRAEKSSNFVLFSGLLTVYLVWFLSWHLISTPLIYALIIPPIQVASEYPRLRWIDDNGLMVLVPLIVILCFNSLGL